MKSTVDDSTVMSVHAQIKYKKVNIIQLALHIEKVLVSFPLVCVGRRERLHREKHLAWTRRLLQFIVASSYARVQHTEG